MPEFVILANTRWEGLGGNSSRQYASAIIRRGWRLCYVQKDGQHLLTPLNELDLGANTVVMCDMPWVESYFDLFMDLKNRGCRTVYRVVDNWMFTPRRSEYREEREIAFITAADAAFASNPLNVERFRQVRPDITLLRNGVDLDYFWNWRGEPPADLHPGNPTVVFVCKFWDPSWVDWQSLCYAAECLPGLSINVLGDASGLPDRPLPDNIHLLGSRLWRQLPAYLHHCRVGLLTYHVERTRYNNSLKVLEYLGCGLPVVCSENPSITDYPYVYFYHGPEELVTKIEQAAGTPIDKDALYRALKEHTWDVRLDLLLARLNHLVAARERTLAPDVAAASGY